MKILEKFIKGKKPDENLCEDGIFISDDFVAIVDGATAKSDKKFDGKATGRVAMEVIIDALSLLPKDADAKSAIKIISDALAELYEKHGLYEHLAKNFVERPTASVIIFSNYKKELWFVGDCQALVDNELINNDKEIDRILSEARSSFLYAELATGVTIDDLMLNDTGRAFITPMLKKQGAFQNNLAKTEYSYDVIDGFAPENCEIRIIDVSKVKELVLASDGYPKIFNNLEETESYLKKVMREDPLCFQLYKSTKGLEAGNASFDDRSYIKINL